MIDNYVQGVNAYIDQALTNPALLPADYAAARPAAALDARRRGRRRSLIGGIFGRGGGAEVAQRRPAAVPPEAARPAAGATAFSEFKEQNDPAAPTTVVDKSFPYEIPGKINPATTAMPDDPRAPLNGGPTDTDAGLQRAAPPDGRAAMIEPRAAMPAHMSNALVVDGQRLGRRPPDSGLRPAGVLLRPGDPDAGGSALARTTTPRVHRSPVPA